jgi:hypothetical protein
MRIFGQLLLVDKQKVPYLCKTTSKETFQDGIYFGFKVICIGNHMGRSAIND